MGPSQAECPKPTSTLGDGWRKRCAARSEPARENIITEPLKDLSGIEGVMFSGGVGEYVYGREERDSATWAGASDLAVRRRLDQDVCRGGCSPRESASAPPRSVRLSTAPAVRQHPSTSRSLESCCRRKNPCRCCSPPCAWRSDRRRASRRCDRVHFRLRCRRGRSRRRLRSGGAASRRSNDCRPSRERSRLAFPVRSKRGNPVYVILDGDIAANARRAPEGGVGHRLRSPGHRRIALRDFDFVDLPSACRPHTVPVTIKSLVFSQDRGSRTAPRSSPSARASTD